MSQRDHSLMGEILSSLQKIEDKSEVIDTPVNNETEIKSNNNVNNLNVIQNQKLTQTLLTSTFLTNTITPNHGTVREPPTNPYEKNTTPTASFQHTLQSCRKNDKESVGVRIYQKKPHVARIWSQNMNGTSRNDMMFSILAFQKSILIQVMHIYEIALRQRRKWLCQHPGYLYLALQLHIH